MEWHLSLIYLRVAMVAKLKANFLYSRGRIRFTEAVDPKSKMALTFKKCFWTRFYINSYSQWYQKRIIEWHRFRNPIHLNREDVGYRIALENLKTLERNEEVKMLRLSQQESIFQVFWRFVFYKIKGIVKCSGTYKKIGF